MTATTSDTSEITHLLEAWRQGDQQAAEAVMPLILEELRRLAASQLRKERADHTLQPTALVNEASLRLVNHREAEWKNRGHFFALAAKTMRRILIDHARSRNYTKRGGNIFKISLDHIDDLAGDQPQDLLALDAALNDLTALDPLKASIVELRFFVGLNLEEIAEHVGCSIATVSRHWLVAKAWLYRELSPSATTPPA
jgi:RNA polymerase sigma factor (TIGR02999 family)